MGSDDKLRLACDRDTKLAAGDGTIAGFGRYGLEFQVVSGLDRFNAE